MPIRCSRAAPAGSLTAGGVLAGRQGVSFSASDAGWRRPAGGDRGRRAAGRRAGLLRRSRTPRVIPCKPAASGSLSFDTATLADGAAQRPRAGVRRDAARTSPPPVRSRSRPPTPRRAALRRESTDVRRLRPQAAARSPTAASSASSAIGAARARRCGVFSQVSLAGAPAKLGRTPDRRRRDREVHLSRPGRAVAALRFAYRAGADALFACSKAVSVAVRARDDAEGVAALDPLRLARALQRPAPRRLRPQAAASSSSCRPIERGRWRSVTTLRTNAHGAFSYRYRFSFRASGTTFPVRVRVRADGSYPFALGHLARGFASASSLRPRWPPISPSSARGSGRSTRRGRSRPPSPCTAATIVAVGDDAEVRDALRRAHRGARRARAAR